MNKTLFAILASFVICLPVLSSGCSPGDALSIAVHAGAAAIDLAVGHALKGSDSLVEGQDTLDSTVKKLGTPTDRIIYSPDGRKQVLEYRAKGQIQLLAFTSDGNALIFRQKMVNGSQQDIEDYEQYKKNPRQIREFLKMVFPEVL